MHIQIFYFTVVELCLLRHSTTVYILVVFIPFTRHPLEGTSSRKFVMGSKSRRRSRSKSRNRSLDRRNRTRVSKSRSPDERRGRSRSPGSKRTSRGRGRSSSGASNHGSPVRPQHRDRSGSSSGGSDGYKSRRAHRQSSKPKDRSTR